MMNSCLTLQLVKIEAQCLDGFIIPILGAVAGASATTIWSWIRMTGQAEQPFRRLTLAIWRGLGAALCVAAVANLFAVALALDVLTGVFPPDESPLQFAAALLRAVAAFFAVSLASLLFVVPVQLPIGLMLLLLGFQTRAFRPRSNKD